MSELQEPHRDPLRTLFRQAGDVGQARAGAAPVARIAERGRRARRRRVAALAAGACLVIAGGGAAAAALLPGTPPPAAPATIPSTGHTKTGGPSTGEPSTGQPSSGPSSSGAASPPPSTGESTREASGDVTYPPTMTSPPGGSASSTGP